MASTRRLAAILAADIVGYSRLMGLDEAGTAQALREHRAAADPIIAEHGGRIVKTTGDGLLIEFASVVGAVECALALQHLAAERNAAVATERRMEWRIGVHLGDVLIEGEDILGDGVNIAARLEGIAEPNGICISEDAFRQVRGKVEVEFVDIGEQVLKNIARPMRVYRVGLSPAAPPPISVPAQLPLPDKPSIAVLPFANMSGDPEQEYFADGMVEEITTAISRLPWLFVIARNSSFTYKGRAVDVKQVGRELGVRYVLEGSVRKAANRVRITGQLIDALTGTHLWADRFDRALDDIFGLQDQVASGVVGAIEPKLRSAEIERAIRKPTDSLDAYDLYLRALAESEMGEAGLREAVALLKTALAIDPSYAAAAARIAYCRIILRSHGFEVSEEEMAETGQLAAQAVRFGNDDAEALAMGAHGAIYFSRADGIAESASDRALALNPNSAWAWVARGWVLALRNRPEPAIEAFERAMRLSPLDPHTYYFLGGVAFAYLYRRRFEEAIEWADRSLNHEPNFTPVLRVKLVACAQLGRVEEARQCRQRVDELQPGLTIAQVKNYPGMSVSPEIMNLFADGFRKAGVPET
jgi:TolB-like protein/class 3 adenylate cyclase